MGDDFELGVDQRVFILAKTAHIVSQYFAHWQDSELAPEELDDRFREFIPGALATGNRREFALMMAEFLAPLRNGHTGYSDAVLYERVPGLGFGLLAREGRWLVSESSHADLAAGDIVTAINDRPVDEWYGEARKYMCLKSEAARKEQSRMWLALMLPDPEIAIAREDRDGARREARVRRTGPLWDPAMFDAPTEGRWLRADTVAYIRVRSFSRPEHEQAAVGYAREYGSAKGLIVDVRGNTGGSTPEDLVRALMDRPWRWSLSSTPVKMGVFGYLAEQGLGYGAFRDARLRWGPERETPGEEPFRGRVIILTDRNTGSAAEDFAVPFKDNGRATLVGEHTFGSTGQPDNYDFGDGISARVSAKRDAMPDGTEFEGAGIAPDIEILKTRDDLYEGRDPALATAMEIAGA